MSVELHQIKLHYEDVFFGKVPFSIELACFDLFLFIINGLDKGFCMENFGIYILMVLITPNYIMRVLYG